MAQCSLSAACRGTSCDQAARFARSYFPPGKRLVWQLAAGHVVTVSLKRLFDISQLSTHGGMAQTQTYDLWFTLRHAARQFRVLCHIALRRLRSDHLSAIQGAFPIAEACSTGQVVSLGQRTCHVAKLSGIQPLRRSVKSNSTDSTVVNCWAERPRDEDSVSQAAYVGRRCWT